MLKVDIIMATYNGAKYVENQLLSILQQTHKGWNLYIHDDGSSDNTVEIVKKYADIDDRIYLIEDNVKKLGVGKNFLHALSFSKENYAIFCDQDDIWLESKVEELLKEIVNKDINDTPILVYCDGYSWDEKGIIHQDSISTNHANKLQDFMMFNGGYQGCSIMMNKKLIDLTKLYDKNIYHHDDLVSLIAHTFGEVYFYPKQLMLYRQHSNAVTGNKDFTKTKFYGVFKNVGFVISERHLEMKKDFYEFYKDEISEKNRKVFFNYFEYCSEASKTKRILNVINNSSTWGGSKYKLLGKTILQRLF